MKKALGVCAAALVCAGAAAQIQSAAAFFKTISDYYGGVRDLEASVSITAPKANMSARLSYKRPDLLRLDFTAPKGQVLVFNGEMLTIYLPGNSAILNQAATGAERGAGLATPQGLSLMSRYYAVSYADGQSAPVPLSSESEEMVVKLLLTPKSASEGFRSIRLAINPAYHLIRRLEAVTVRNETFTMLFTDYAVNQGIADQRFIYDSPATANMYDNFLFSE